MLSFVSKFQGGTEKVTISQDGNILFIATKIDSFTPYWELREIGGNKVGEYKTLADIEKSIDIVVL